MASLSFLGGASELHRDARGGIAPITVAIQATDGAHLHRVTTAWSQVLQRDTREGEHSGGDIDLILSGMNKILFETNLILFAVNLILLATVGGIGGTSYTGPKTTSPKQVQNSKIQMGTGGARPSNSRHVRHDA
jgi:hypothetical protein